MESCDNFGCVISITSDITKNAEYYPIAHRSKFVRPGALRVHTDKFSTSSKLESVAFLNQDGSKVFVAPPRSPDKQKITVQFGENQFDYSVEGRFVWQLIDTDAPVARS